LRDSSENGLKITAAQHFSKNNSVQFKISRKLCLVTSKMTLMHFANYASKKLLRIFCEAVQVQLFGGYCAAEAATEILFDFKKLKIRFPDFQIWLKRTFFAAQLSIFQIKKEKLSSLGRIQIINSAALNICSFGRFIWRKSDLKSVSKSFIFC
jgi:hypothetical protein